MLKNKAISVLEYLNEKGYVNVNIEDILIKKMPSGTVIGSKGEFSFLEKYKNLLSQTTNGYVSNFRI